MEIRHYVVLYNTDNKAFIIPYKAVQNAFDNTSQEAGATPAFFGGPELKGGIEATLKAKIVAQSRDILEYLGPSVQFYSNTVNDISYHYYWTKNWRYSGSIPGTPSNREEGEMERVAEIPFSAFEPNDSDDQILEKLICWNTLQYPSEENRTAFFQSETPKAIIAFIRDPPAIT